MITLGKGKATIIPITSIYFSRQLIRVILNALAYSRDKVLVHAQPSCIEFATTAFPERPDRYEAQRRSSVFFRRCDFLWPKWSGRTWVVAEMKPALCMIELDESEDIINCLSCSGFIWRPQFRSERRLVEQHTLYRIIEEISPDV